MPLYTVIRKPIKTGLIPKDAVLPTGNILLNDIKTYPKIYLFNSLDTAEKIAKIFFHAPREPKVGGSYGLIAEVSVQFNDIPLQHVIDISSVYNNWVESQNLGYEKKDMSNVEYECSLVCANQVKSVIKIFIPDEAKVYNNKLKDTDYTQQTPNKCNLM